MPEGDTIFRTAAVLQRALAGKTVTRFETMLPKLERIELEGRTIERVAARGKHLIIDFSGDVHLHTHMRMNGSWHIYKRGERWRRPRSDMRFVIETGDYVAVGFNVPVAEFVTRAPEVGPDLLSPEFDASEALRRLKSRGDDEIANALLDQQVMAGVGNIWKSEALHRSKVNPFTRVRDLSDDALTKIIDNARKLLRASATGRVQQQVYSRGGRPCRKCGTPIAYRRQGADARGTYWCPTCQATSASSSSRSK